MSMKHDQEVLHSEFNIETHKNTFINYLEVIIDDEGKIMYAVPSHTEKLIELYMEKYKVNRSDIVKHILIESIGLDTSSWLCEKLHCICVWDDRYYGKPNQIQLNKLKTLRLSGVYHGPTHDIYEEEQKKLKAIMDEFKEIANNYNKEV